MLRSYLQKIERIREQPESTPELSLREPFLELVREIGRESGRRLLVAPEAHAGEVGQPDVYVKDGPRLVGFLETKAPGVDLEHLLRTDRQLKKYKQSLPNWVLCDYYRFIFLRDGEVVARASVEGEQELRAAFLSFLSYLPPTIRSPRRLAKELARRARVLRDGLLGELRGEPEEGGPLGQVLSFYKQTVMSDLDEEGFADTFAQTITYGMFLGRLCVPEGPFTRIGASATLPGSVPFLRSAVRVLTDDDLLSPAVIRLLDDLAALLENTDVARVREEVSAGGLERDLVLFFYEDFLEQYDAGERKKKAVYYTPPELVGFLVRAVQGLLARDFNLKGGLADPTVTLLDPAVGTGTFLLGAADQALGTVRGRGSAEVKKLIREHLIPHFFGFELLPAPYAIAHLKLTTFFEQAGFQLENRERIQVLLTNTLEQRDETGHQMLLLPMFRGIVEEGRTAGKVKYQTQVLVIVGNPPYDRTSHNRNAFSDRLQEDFFHVDGERIRDRNPAPLRDDYLRFLRWGVWKLMDQPGAPGHGILAFVTNRAFIDRVLHRGVRRFFLQRFDEIYIYDLHGDQREWYRDRVDEKVFKRVQAGIALAVFVKRPGAAGGVATVRYREEFGTRKEKLDRCRGANLDDTGWQTLSPRAPLWLFVPNEVPGEYDTWPSVAQLFPAHVSGVQTHRDQLVVAMSEADLRATLRQFADARVPDSHWTARKVTSTRDWNLQRAREALRASPLRNVLRWTYRPFDRRWIAFDKRLVEYPRTELSAHLIDRDDNLALAFAYGSLKDGPYALVSRRPMPAAVLSWRTLGQAYFAPWMIHNPVTGDWDENLPPTLLDRLAAVGIVTTGRGLLEYVYAVLNAPAYRAAFGDGLRYGFGRIPLARDPAVFERIRGLGAELVASHLLEHEGLDRLAPAMDGDDRGIIAVPRYDEATRTIHLGPDLVARAVPQGVWDYQHGAYRVLPGFLGEREGRSLSPEEFEDFRLTAGALARTLEILPEVDRLIPEARAGALSAHELGIGPETTADPEPDQDDAQGFQEGS